MRIYLLIFLLLVVTFLPASASENYDELIEKTLHEMSSLEQDQWAYKNDWTFKVVETTKDEMTVAIFDPRRPEYDRWQLDSVNNETPSSRQLKKFRKRKKEEQEKGDLFSDLSFSEMITKETVTFVRKENELAYFSFLTNVAGSACLGPDSGAELEDQFERGFEVGLHLGPPTGNDSAAREFFIARLDGQRVGCGAAKTGVGSIKRVWVARSTRGLLAAANDSTHWRHRPRSSDSRFLA